MTRRASTKAGPVEEPQLEERPGDTPSTAEGEPVLVDDQTAAAAVPESTEEDVRSGVPGAVAEEREVAAVAEREPEPAEPDGEMAVPAFALATTPAVPASSMDSLTLPERSRHDAEARRERRRRSATRLPALVSPVDIPEDAEGRVDFAVIRGGADRDEPAPSESPAAPESEDRVRHLLTLGSGWVAVAALAAGLFAVFIVLSLLYR